MNVYNPVRSATRNPVYNPVAKRGGFVFPEFSGLIGRWDPRITASLTTSGSDVTGMADQSTAANDLANLTGTREPTNDGIINGRSALSYIGPDPVPHFLVKAATTLGAGGLTLFMVVNVTVTDNAFGSIVSLDATNDFQIDAFTTGQFFCNVRRTNLGIGTLQSPTDLLGNPFVMALNLDEVGLTSELWIDGALVDSDVYNGSLTSPTQFALGMNRGETSGIECVIGESLLYDVSLPAGEMTATHDYLLGSWGI